MYLLKIIFFLLKFKCIYILRDHQIFRFRLKTIRKFHTRSPDEKNKHRTSSAFQLEFYWLHFSRVKASGLILICAHPSRSARLYVFFLNCTSGKFIYLLWANSAVITRIKFSHRFIWREADAKLFHYRFRIKSARKRCKYRSLYERQLPVIELSYACVKNGVMFANALKSVQLIHLIWFCMRNIVKYYVLNK